jgi:serine/threonine protein phosphatase PrpC
MWQVAVRAGLKDEDGIRVIDENTVIVCDGHGGQECKDFMLQKAVNLSGLNSDETVMHIKGVNEEFLQTSMSEASCLGKVSGTTLTTLTVNEGKIHVTWLGDSRAIVVRNSGVVALTVDDEVSGKEAAAAKARGAIFATKNGSTYLTMRGARCFLNMTRALGDKTLRPVVSDEAHVLSYNIRSDDTHVVVASDGIWKVLGNTEVAELLRRGAPLDEIIDKALKRYTGEVDDISIAVYALPKRCHKRRRVE